MCVHIKCVSFVAIIVRVSEMAQEECLDCNGDMLVVRDLTVKSFIF